MLPGARIQERCELVALAGCGKLAVVAAQAGEMRRQPEWTPSDASSARCRAFARCGGNRRCGTLLAGREAHRISIRWSKGPVGNDVTKGRKSEHPALLAEFQGPGAGDRPRVRAGWQPV